MVQSFEALHISFSSVAMRIATGAADLDTHVMCCCEHQRSGNVLVL